MGNHVKTNARATGHPTIKTFVTVGLVLAVITAIEFSIVYLQGMRGTIIALLFVLSAVKFYLVAQYFMHLRFEGKFLSYAFAVGLVLAIMIAIAQNFVNLA
jgi:cytochrome c oxidase subunit IV